MGTCRKDGIFNTLIGGGYTSVCICQSALIYTGLGKSGEELWVKVHLSLASRLQNVEIVKAGNMSTYKIVPKCTVPVWHSVELIKLLY